MRVLCDEHVAPKYVDALERTGGITVATAPDKVSPSAPDSKIAAYAAAHDWVVLTNDNDFFSERQQHGLLYYSQIENPPPGDVVDAILAINGAYESNGDAVEKVPDGWV
ncbi:hypothetical protein BRC76_09030 [Halobacteriales archaeon QH_8_67_36]|nr:MAG: hypothetical protein BRC76_09030 [Halobacteriales archaeon QH_8_67_36]